MKEEGVLAEFQAQAIKEVIAWQLSQAMEEKRLSKRKLAAMMHASRIETLQRAAAILGRKVQVELV